ncbi:hypothetical protein C0U40_11300 [Amylibacter cionae]|nr:hypothetical protein C0U40_11300 [Amylibacter cionae]
MKQVICLILSLVLALTAFSAPTELRASVPDAEMAQMAHPAPMNSSDSGADCIGCDPADANTIAGCNDACPVNCMAGNSGACTLVDVMSVNILFQQTLAHAMDKPLLSGMAAPPEPFPPKQLL